MLARTWEQLQLPIGANQQYLSVVPSQCQHENGFTNEICNDCGYECTDHEYQNGQCLVCGYECEHYEIEDGHCMECKQHLHEFADMDCERDWSDDHE